MKLTVAKRILLGSTEIKKIYHGATLVYSWVTIPPSVSNDTVSNVATADTYEEGNTTWGDITLSSGCTLSEDGVEMQNEETYISTTIDPISYPMTFEYKARIDEVCYKAQANNPGMLFGIGPTQNSWGDGITCYSTTDYGIILDTTGAMTITTGTKPTYCHIVLTVNSSGIMTIYINGINNSWSTSSTNYAIKSTKTYIFNGQGVGRFVGAVSIIRIWNNELSTDEITKLFADDDAKYTL